MIQFLGLIMGIAGEVDPQLAERAGIHPGENNGGMRLAALKTA